MDVRDSSKHAKRGGANIICNENFSFIFRKECKIETFLQVLSDLRNDVSVGEAALYKV